MIEIIFYNTDKQIFGHFDSLIESCGQNERNKKVMLIEKVF